jgi:hypothetical protein
MPKSYFRPNDQMVDTRLWGPDNRPLPTDQYPALHSPVNRADLTCSVCQGHRIQQEDITLRKHPRLFGGQLDLKKLVKYGVERRAYCLDCGKSWVISRDSD